MGAHNHSTVTMTHSPEVEIEVQVEERLKDLHGEEAVQTQVYLPETGRFCDIVADLPHVTLCIEVESREEALTKGVGQTLLYAGHYPDGVPVIITPLDHLQEPEANIWRQRGVVILEYDEETGDFLGGEWL